MKCKIKYTNFIKTFSERGCQDIIDYNKVMELHSKGHTKKEIKKLVKVSDDKALLLREKGLSAYKIAAKLKVKPYHVKSWVYYGKKPLLYDYFKQNPFRFQ